MGEAIIQTLETAHVRENRAVKLAHIYTLLYSSWTSLNFTHFGLVMLQLRCRICISFCFVIYCWQSGQWRPLLQILTGMLLTIIIILWPTWIAEKTVSDTLGPVVLLGDVCSSLSSSGRTWGAYSSIKNCGLLTKSSKLYDNLSPKWQLYILPLALSKNKIFCYFYVNFCIFLVNFKLLDC